MALYNVLEQNTSQIYIAKINDIHYQVFPTIWMAFTTINFYWNYYSGGIVYILDDPFLDTIMATQILLTFLLWMSNCSYENKCSHISYGRDHIIDCYYMYYV